MFDFIVSDLAKPRDWLGRTSEMTYIIQYNTKRIYNAPISPGKNRIRGAMHELCQVGSKTLIQLIDRRISLFICSSGQILLLQYLTNALNNFNKTVGEYSLARAENLTRF